MSLTPPLSIQQVGLKRETPSKHQHILMPLTTEEEDEEDKSHAEGGSRAAVHVTAAQWAADVDGEGDDDELAALAAPETDEPADGGGTHAGGPVDVTHVKAFTAARSKHYNEWQAVLAARAAAAEEDEEDDEDEGS